MSEDILTGDALYEAWDAELAAPPPPSWTAGDAVMGHVGLSPGRIILLGGAPGAGKTALVTQVVFDALVRDPGVRAAILNVEMTPNALLTRQLARLSGVSLAAINRRTTTEADAPRLAGAKATIRALLPRLAFAPSPRNLDPVLSLDMVQHDPQIIVLDYIQRLGPLAAIQRDKSPDGLREKTNAVMSDLRLIADTGRAVIAVAALRRGADARGNSTYSGRALSLASFRESSELEYGCDDALLLYPEPPPDKTTPADPDAMRLDHAKARHGEPTDKTLRFHRRTQRFSVWSPLAPPTPPIPPHHGIAPPPTPTSIVLPGESHAAPTTVDPDPF